ncbi:hypothetical protein [Actinomycetospora aeridis]|uniref:Uncharacterized protein n=1 Tax=Actinomycetospora aeridis TaxID=3129231 RepID=A0ABU8N180_9PSEU
MTAGRRAAPRTRPRWRSWARSWAPRIGSALLVIAIGLGTYLAWDRVQHQDCLNIAYQRSLDERGRAIDDLVGAIATANRRLLEPDGRTQRESRLELEADLRRVQQTRDAAREQTRREQGSECG